MTNITLNIAFDNAKLTDLPALVKLLNTLFSIEQDFQPDIEKQITGLTLILNNPYNAVIRVVRNTLGEVVGMVSVQLVISTSQGTPSAWIEDMVIHEQYRAQGFGRLLLDSALDWAKQKGATRAQLLVDLDNEPALGYYNHLGWQPSNMGMRRIFIK